MRRGLGLDLKYGLGPAFTLSATINPDFGQVEADPSQVNLGPNELFFAEKRPFFLEGVDLFKLPIGNSDNTVEGQFYSRRIGATPDTSNLDYQYLRTPTSTTIFGAMKLTGKTRDGWSLGVLDAVTGGEDAALIDEDGSRQNPMIAALTNYAVGRVKRDFRDGKSYGRHVRDRGRSRSLEGTPLAATASTIRRTPAGSSSIIAGTTTRGRPSSRRVGSWVHGTEDAIANTQTLNRHLFQRPDAKDVHFDPTLHEPVGRRRDVRRSAGWATPSTGAIGVGGDLRTPGLELNDVGFQQPSDQLRAVRVLRAITTTRSGRHGPELAASTATCSSISNFDPIARELRLRGQRERPVRELLELEPSARTARAAVCDPVALRGGPALRFDPTRSTAFMALTTDTRKRLIRSA